MVTKDNFKMLVVISIFAFLASAAASEPIHKRKAISLDILLFCASDKLLQSVFDTDRITAASELNRSLILIKRIQKEDSGTNFITKGFTTESVGNNDLEIFPVEGLGDPIPETKLSFCQYHPVASHLSTEENGNVVAKPHVISISGDDWVLNPIEVLSHADQFSFTSGVFSDSSRVFLVARKGNVAIQFICNQTGLTFYRALY